MTGDRPSISEITGLRSALNRLTYLVGRKAEGSHTHAEYAPSDHTHAEYAAADHQHAGTGTDSLAIGPGATANHQRSIALGANATTAADDEAVMNVQSLRIVSAPGTPSYLALKDETGAERLIGINASGQLFVL